VFENAGRRDNQEYRCIRDYSKAYNDAAKFVSSGFVNEVASRSIGYVDRRAKNKSGKQGGSSHLQKNGADYAPPGTRADTVY
jgi:hypothetical protein